MDLSICLSLSLGLDPALLCLYMEAFYDSITEDIVLCIFTACLFYYVVLSENQAHSINELEFIFCLCFYTQPKNIYFILFSPHPSHICFK